MAIDIQGMKMCVLKYVNHSLYQNFAPQKYMLFHPTRNKYMCIKSKWNVANFEHVAY